MGKLLDIKESNYWQRSIKTGDFNITISQNEKHGGSIVRDAF
jgi:hypothetical protein